ncbi:hypothetical protein FI667_g3423, partial [Globisporangium splendens]
MSSSVTSAAVATSSFAAAGSQAIAGNVSNDSSLSNANSNDTEMVDMDVVAMSAHATTATSPSKEHDAIHTQDQGQVHTAATNGSNPVDPSGNALFDYSSYTGGAPSLLSGASASVVASASSEATHGVHDGVSASLFGQELEAVGHELIEKAIEHDEKKTGRPAHPAWEHFARGEKRNRFHHNAYCRHCAANGVDPEPIRGVSGNMIRHLQKCIYCPAEIVTQLKVLCAQKDAASFSKRHQAHPSDVDLLLQESSPVPTKRVKRSNNGSTSEALIPLPNDVASTTSTSSSALSGSTGMTGERGAQGTDEEFMPLQLPLLSSELASPAAQNALSLHAATMTASSPAFTPKVVSATVSSRSGSTSIKARAREASSKRNYKTSSVRTQALPDQRLIQAPLKPVDPVHMNRLVLKATLSAGLPWDWMWMGESARILFGDLHSSLKLSQVSSQTVISVPAHEKQLAKIKDEYVGVTLAINSWVSKYQKTNFTLFSLVNALGEASAWDLVDLGMEEPTSEVFAEKIKTVLMTLHEQGVQVISIVADTTNGYAAARFAVSSMESSNHDIPVLPCFSHFLSLLLGAVLTVSTVYVETMGDVIEIVQMFSNQRVLKVLRRECGDQDASLVLPAKDNWYSFIECIDSVRQYEDVIKIIASKVLAAASSSPSLSSTSASAAHFHGANSGVPGGVARPARKDSAGNTVDDLAETRLSPSVLRAIQNPEFWENVVSLSELMSPIKETHKIMSSGSVSQFSVSDVFYQFGRMHQQYGIIISDWEENTIGRRTMEHVRFLQSTVNKMWKLYDQPLMFLSYILNYNLVYPHLSLNHPSLQWLSIGKYAKEYFRRWFCSASPSRGNIAGAGTRIHALSEDTASRFLEDILAYKERKYPFDTESVCEIENPRSFYLLVSDSNPLMHMFGSRLFSLATTVPPLADVVQGNSFLPSAASSVAPKDVMLSVLQMKLFAQTAVRPSKDLLAFIHGTKSKATGDANNNASVHLGSDAVPDGTTSSSVSAASSRGAAHQQQTNKSVNLDCGMDTRACVNIWSKRQWTRLAKEWRAHWKKETDIDELLRNLALLDPGLFRFSPNLSLDQIFKDKLPSRLPQDREEAVVDV